MLDKKKSFIMNVADRKQIQKSMEEVGTLDQHKMDNSRTAAVILAIGLLIHNIFEGMSIGLQPNEVQL